MSLPTHGRPTDDALTALTAMRANDVLTALTAMRANDVLNTLTAMRANDALTALTAMRANDALNTLAGPSLPQIQREVVGAMAELRHGDEAAGFMTSGGTESILTAVNAADLADCVTEVLGERATDRFAGYSTPE